MGSYQKDKRLSKHLDFIAMDFLILEGSFLLASLIRYAAVPGRKWLFADDQFSHQFLILFLALLVTISLGNPYKNVLKRGRAEEVFQTFRHTMTLLLIDIVCLFFIHEAGSMSRVVFGLTWVLYFGLELLFRTLWKSHLHRLYKTHGGWNSMILLSDSQRAGKLINDLYANPLRDFFIPAVFLTDYEQYAKNQGHNQTAKPDMSQTSAKTPAGFTIGDILVMGGPQDMVQYAAHNWVDSAFLDIHDNRQLEQQMTELFSQMGITTNSLLTAIEYNEDEGVQYVEQFGRYVVLSQTIRYVPFSQIFFKRLLDIIGGLVGCALTGILFIFVAPAIYRKSPGPIFFTQVRVGKNGKPFKMYKFRSMYLDAEQRKQELMAQNKIQDGMMFKMDDDPRIIGSEKKDKNGKPKGIGNFIRKTSIDEFPQFFNVLKGDMSLVGTRPPTMDEWERYSLKHRARMSIRPGITGMWQISGRSNVVDFDQIVELDTQYIQTWTIGLDLRIIAKTILVVLKHEGAE